MDLTIIPLFRDFGLTVCGSEAWALRTADHAPGRIRQSGLGLAIWAYKMRTTGSYYTTVDGKEPPAWVTANTLTTDGLKVGQQRGLSVALVDINLA